MSTITNQFGEEIAPGDVVVGATSHGLRLAVVYRAFTGPWKGNEAKEKLSVYARCSKRAVTWPYGKACWKLSDAELARLPDKDRDWIGQIRLEMEDKK